MSKMIEKLLHNYDARLMLTLTSISFIALTLLISMLPSLDKSNIDSAFYVLNRLPSTYWMGVGALVSALLLCFTWKNCSPGYIVALIIASIMYMDLPRFMYENCFQMEYFHQAQVFHVLNYGRATDPEYPYPVADVAHAIFSAIFIDVTSLQAGYAVSHILPIILRLVLAISMLNIATYFKTSKYSIYLLIMTPLYVFISDTEPSFTNHYTFVLPLFAFFIYLMIKFESEGQSRLHILLLLIASALVFSHIYFATLIAISLFAHFSFNEAIKRAKGLRIPYTLTPIVIFLLWHGYMCKWSIGVFYSEINYALLPAIDRFSLLPAIDRFLTFEINPLTYVSKAQERYGLIPIKSDYLNVLLLKNFIVLAINIIMLGIIVYVLFCLFRKQGFRKTMLSLLIRRITYLWGFSALFLAIYGLTGTAHPQRVLEAFVIPNCGLTLLLLKSLEGDLKIFKESEFKAKKSVTLTTVMVLAITLMSISFIPLKVVAHWGTSLTYMGFSQKSIHEAEFLSKYGNNELSIHYIGSDPYWFLTEIVNKWTHVQTFSLNGQEGEQYFTETIRNIKYSLNIRSPHYIYSSPSSLFAMRAKYAIEPHLYNFTKEYVDLMNQANTVYMNSLTESIFYVP